MSDSSRDITNSRSDSMTLSRRVKSHNRYSVLKRNLSLLITLAGLVLAFQNCAPQAMQGINEANLDQKPLGGSFNEVEKVVYGPAVELKKDLSRVTEPSVEVDLHQGHVLHESASGIIKSCKLSEDRLLKLHVLFEQMKNCPVPEDHPDLVQCLAYSYADIRVDGVKSDGQKNSLLLRPDICGQSDLVCPEFESALRSELKSIASEGCL